MNTKARELASEAKDLMERIERFGIDRKGPCQRNNIISSCDCAKCERLRIIFKVTQSIPQRLQALA